MKTARIVFIVLLIISTLSIQSQSIESNEAEDLFARKRFTAVWQYYKKILKTDSLNTELNYKMGICYLNSRSQKEKAIDCFKQATKSIDQKTSKSAIDYKLLANACYLVSNFDDAILNYKKYAKIILSSNSLLANDINRELEMYKMAGELKELKDFIDAFKNHKCDGAEKNNKKLHHTTKIFKDKDFFEDKALEVNINPTLKSLDSTRGPMETTVATSVDGQIMLIYRNDEGNGNLYVSKLNENEWMAPERLNKPINNKSWETNEFISTDGEELYFESNREGGFGGKDIYKSTKLQNGDWGKAVNMGALINTSFDEEAPFIHPDGVTLYFSSNRHRIKYDFDNFTSILLDSGKWTKPINVGYPFHKTESNPINKKTEIISNSNTEKGDYLATFINQKQTPITIIKGKIIGSDKKKPPYIEVAITNNETGKMIAIYHPDSKTGKYIFIVPSGKNNNITCEAEGYLFHSENIYVSKESNFYKIQKIVELAPIASGSKTSLNNIFFEDNKAALMPTSNVELNTIFDLLILYPKLIIEISSIIYKKSSKQDVKMEEDRLQLVLNFLFEKGISKKNVAVKVYTKKKKYKKKLDETNMTENETGKLTLKILAIK